MKTTDYRDTEEFRAGFWDGLENRPETFRSGWTQPALYTAGYISGFCDRVVVERIAGAAVGGGGSPT